MNIDRAIKLVELERDYLVKKNDPENKKLLMEIAEALNMAIAALKAVEQIQKVCDRGR